MGGEASPPPPTPHPVDRTLACVMMLCDSLLSNVATSILYINVATSILYINVATSILYINVATSILLINVCQAVPGEVRDTLEVGLVPLHWTIIVLTNWLGGWTNRDHERH